MRVLVFDVETSGLPPKQCKNVTLTNVMDWPYIVQFSYIIFDTETSNIQKISDNIIKVPEWVTISEESIELHGITKEKSINKGKDMQEMLVQFTFDIKGVSHVVGHNISFDMNMVKASFYRLLNSEMNTENSTNNSIIVSVFNKFAEFTTKITFACTMRENISRCNIRRVGKDGSTYKKFPTLNELHKNLFDIEPKNLHNSLYDVIICMRCYYKVHFDKDLCESSDVINNYMKEIM
jgi:DNA polymerase III epsilon subunit-like protein